MVRGWAMVLLAVLIGLGVYVHIAFDRWRALDDVTLATAGVRPFDLPVGHGAEAVGLPLPEAVEAWYWTREALPRLDAALIASPELRIRIANALDEVEAGGGPVHAERLADLRERLQRAGEEGVARIERIDGASLTRRDGTVATGPARTPATDPAPLPDAVVDALTGEVVDAGTPLAGNPARVGSACPARVGTAALARVEFFGGEPADDTQLFPVDVDAGGEPAALFVFRGEAVTVRCTYGDGAGAPVIESPLAGARSCLVEDRGGTLRVTCPSPVAAP